ncbi:MAG TPA: DegV family protein, partial [Azospira sp.]|nr:DegV family protein [Azospira sp.]
MRIGIIVDSCCDLPRQFLDQHEIVVLPIGLRIGGAVIRDRRDPEETHRFYATHVDRKSEDFAESIPYSPAQIEQVFLDKMVIDYDYVFVLTITSERSPIYDHALQASRSVLTKYKDPRREIGKPGRFGLCVLSS